jgi:Adaptin AP4 complex epsilon appendage platform
MGLLPITSPVSLTWRQVTSLDAFMKQCEMAGLHPIESIGTTNEGISAGMVEGGSKIVLIHGKVSPLGLGEAKPDDTVNFHRFHLVCIIDIAKYDEVSSYREFP